MQANPGVYAVLIGSGMSSAAGIPTGWQVVEDLVGRIARSQGIDLEDLGLSPQSWWTEIGGGSLRYDHLLESLAPTPSARQGLLRGFFEPAPEASGSRQPTTAHHSIASLCAQGAIRVVMTTNFDRLIEHALDDAGVSHQVIESPAAARTMTPIVHSPVTVLKLHGDYLATDLRNTVEELGAYPEEWQTLLNRILDEFGLIVLGWSGEHDAALAAAISNVAIRRYPVYWASRSENLGQEARRIVRRRDAFVLPIGSADEFLADLESQVERLASIAARRRSFTILRHPINYPDQSSAPWGWTALPMLTLRTYASLEVASVDDTGIIGPEVRERLTEVLGASAVLSHLQGLQSGFTPADSLTCGPVDTQRAIQNSWVAVEGRQSIDYALYRWGSDADTGVSALFTVALPSMNRLGHVGITFDVGISALEPLPIGQAALLLRDGVVLTALEAPTAIADLLPMGCDLARVEGCFSASEFTGRNEPGQRSNDLAQRVDWISIEAPPPGFGPLCGFAVLPGEPMGLSAAGQIVVEGLNHMLLAHGFLDPRQGISLLRSTFGLDESTGPD